MLRRDGDGHAVPRCFLYDQFFGIQQRRPLTDIVHAGVTFALAVRPYAPDWRWQNV